MPITFPAHQAVVLPLKMRWPDHTDATALCVGAAAPDLGYAVVHGQSHQVMGALLFALPFTLLTCALLRWRAGASVFANLPDLGPFRVWSYRAISDRRPALIITVSSAAIGIASHLLIDAFTHDQRWGATWLGLDTTMVRLPGRAPMSVAHLLQYGGHTIGSLIGILLFLAIGRRRLMERRYGADVVARARRVSLRSVDRTAFWLVAVVVALPIAAAGRAGGSRGAFPIILGGVVGLLVAGCLPQVGGRKDTASEISEVEGRPVR